MLHIRIKTEIGLTVPNNWKESYLVCIFITIERITMKIKQFVKRGHKQTHKAVLLLFFPNKKIRIQSTPKIIVLASIMKNE